MAVVAPMATWKPLTRSMSTTPLVHDIICLHTMVGTLGGSWSWSNRPGGSYWHFGLGGSGALWQCQDLRYKSAANLNGNWHVIPIETEDMGSFFGSWSGHCGDVPGWTDAQINKIVELVAWLCARYNIPPVLIPDTQKGRRGIAYHRQGIDPHRHPNGERWSNAYGKCCPDHRRIWQLINIVIPRVKKILAGGSAPSTTPVQEDDEMILRFATAGRPERLLMGSFVHGWSSGADKNAVIKALRDAGYKVAGPAVLTAKGYDQLTASALQGQDLDKLNATLGQVGMYSAALAAIEDREEQRDLAEA